MKRVIFSVFPIIVATAFSAASAYTLTGTVKDKDDSTPVKATVKLLKKGKETETDQAGKFTIHEDDAVSIREFRGAIGHFSLMNGILNFSQGSSAPMQVKVFDVAGNQVLNKTLQGSGSIDLAASIGAQGTYVAKIRLGSAQETVRFTSYGSAAGSLGAEAQSLRKEGDDSDTLRVVADQYDTLFVPLANLDTTLDLKLSKASTKQTYAFGWPKGNDPVPTRGCGKDTQLSKSGQFKFTWTYKGESTTRDVYYDLPNNYDKNKPYRLIFGMQCMGGSAQNVARNENYYGMKPFDKEGTTIFV
ncbi:MAG: T9SS type A sorting domain-containing protein, partial [Fibrobacter sp.]|nr:T9SS type A sorting domain-containing protein [Fibrobacter sp.]